MTVPRQILLTGATGYIFEVSHVHRVRRPASGRPLLFLGYRAFATLGDRDRFRP